MLKERETYTATKGVENEGYDFEVAMLAFYCFHLSYSDALDFKIAIYDNQYHPFDDIVIDITTEVTEKYAIQLKHVKDKLLLNSNHFGKNGKMVLSKYFKYDFSKSDHVVLLTNGVVNEEIVVGNCTIKTKKLLTPMEEWLDTSSDDEDHIYEIYNDENSKKITFYTSQKSRVDIDEAVKRKFKERFFPDGTNVDGMVQKFRNFFQEWKKGAFNICKLDKEDIKMKISEILFFDHIVEYRPKFQVEVPSKTELFQKVLSDYNVTIVEDITDESLSSLCCFNIPEEEILNDGQKLLINANDNEYKEKAVILWRLKKFPLTLKVTVDNQKVIIKLVKELDSQNLSFMLIGNISRGNFPQDKVLTCLSDLEKHHLYGDVVQDFKVSIQGQEEVSLNQLIVYNPNFARIITTKELVLISKGNFLVGEVEECLPQPYIQRRLITSVLKITTLEHFPNDLFVVRGDSKSLREKLPRCNFWKFKDFSEVMSLGKSVPPKSIVTCTNTKEFATSVKYKYSNVHCLKIIDDDHLKLFFSKEKSESLKQFQVCPETDLHTLPKKINVICGRPGMGKMTMARNLKRSCPPGFWTTTLDFQEQNFFQPVPCLEYKFRECFKEVKRVIYFFCNLDNMQDSNLQRAIFYAKKKASEGFKVWVFATDHLRETLEKAFDVFAMNIEQFSEEEQKQYVQKRLKQHHMDQGFEKILKCFKMLKHNDILGAPMHLYMLTEIFIDDPQATMEKVFVVTDIFKHFIKTRYQNYLSKVSSYHPNQLTEDGIYYRTEQYKKAAMSEINVNLKVKVQCDRNFLEQINRIGDVVGIILKISKEGSLIFTQQTYADYFAALWIVDHYHDVQDRTQLILREEFKNVLFMFNLEMCRNNPAHIAVLYQNLKQLQESELKELDPLRRSPLHLACGYETKISKLPSAHDKNLFKYHTQELVKEDEEVKRIIDFLVVNTQPDPLQVDDLFGWNLFDYAFNSLNLYAIERLLSEFPSTSSVVLNKLNSLEDDFFTVIYFCVKFGHTKLLELTTQLNHFSMSLQMENCNGEGLIYLAVKYGFYEVVRILLDQGVNSEAVTVMHNKRSPLHVAAEYGYVDIVELLLHRGASVDIMDRYRNTPLHLASSKGNCAAAKLLLKFGADVNFSDNFGRTSLQLAATYGHSEVLQVLLDNGALMDTCDKLGNSLLGCDKKHQNIVKILERKTKLIEDVDEYIKFQLHWVASTGQVEEVERLIREGWDINMVDSCGRTALYRAVVEDFIKVAETCINNNADVDITDSHQIGALCRAISNQNREITKLLVDKDVNVEVVDGFGYTPLHWATITGNVSIIKLLLEKKPNLDATDGFQRTPIECAMENGHFKAVATLTSASKPQEVAKNRFEFLKHYNATLGGKLSSFEEAVITNNHSLVKKFLKQDKKLSVESVLPETIIRGHKRILELLLQKNVVRNKNRLLHWAAFSGNVEIVKLLVRYKVNVNTLDEFGYNSVSVAAMRGYSEVLEVLLKNGGDDGVEDGCGNTPLKWACKKGYEECVRVLLEKNSDQAIQEDLLNMVKKQKMFLKIAKLE